MNASELVYELENSGKYFEDRLYRKAVSMIRAQQAEIEALNGEIEIVSKLLIGEPISDDDMEKYWNPLHSTLVSRLRKAQNGH